VTAFLAFHALDLTALLLLVGIVIALWRRATNAGLVATQRFGFDLMPLVLLLAVALTGLALTGSSLFWAGRYYWFISLTHQVVVVAWLVSLPFGKFFHIIERPATIGVTLSRAVDEGSVPCVRCRAPLPSPQFVDDLKATLADLGQRYDLGPDGSLQDYCPTCKRLLRGRAYYQLMGQRFL
jgi:hypothetical protein